MSTTDNYADVFEPVSEEEWASLGGNGQAAKGMYVGILKSFLDSGHRTATISVTKGRFQGKKASSVATALKTARDGKNAPKEISEIEVTSKGPSKDGNTPGLVFLKNPAVAGE